MKIEIFGKNYNVSDSLKAMTTKKCAKLNKFFGDDDTAVARFVVTLENGTYTTDLSVVYHAQTYRASANSDAPYDNLDVVIPRLAAQITKQKDMRGGKSAAEGAFD
jgi:ribosomal subunit interface protein